MRLAWVVLTCVACNGTGRLALGAQATGTGGTLQGIVTDPTGAVIPNAVVTLSNGVTSYDCSAKSGADGSFRIANIPHNTYQLEISSPGLQNYKQTIDIRTAVPIQIKAVMALASASETVTVSAAAETVENVPSAHTDVSQNLISDLPISGTGQGLSDAITLTSGSVVADSNGFFHPQGDHAETSYMVDGQMIGDQQNKTFSTQLPSNAFQSLELVTSSPSAEYGGKTGLIVNAQTRSGLGSKPTGSLDLYYGSFGTMGEDATFGVGGEHWGNFIVLDSSRSGRFLDSPEFHPFHDIGNTETIFDRADYQPGAHDSLHLDMFAARNWFQIPVTYDQPNQDQRQQARTLSFSLGYQHVFGSETLLSIYPFVRQDRVNYYPSGDPFDDTPATIGQDRHLTNWGTRANLSFVNGINSVKIGTELMQTQLAENFSFALTDPTYNPVCLNTAGSPVAAPGVTNPAACGALGYIANPGLAPGLVAYDLTRGGTPFYFHGTANINQQAFYAEDQITFRGLNINPGLRFDNYDGISQDRLVEPRIGGSYLIRMTGTVVRASFDRTMETPYNEDLVLSSTTGAGGLASTQFGSFGAEPLRPGHRTQYDAGLEQGIGKYVQIETDYFWKFTKNAFDFDTLFNTPIAFPIEWRQSRIDGFSARVSTRKMRGFQAYTTIGHTRARFFGPENGGLIFNSPLNTGVFRIDHDQAFQQTTFLRYQRGKEGPWAAFTWRYDSGEVAGSVTSLQDALALDADQQAAIGFHCGSVYATVGSPITSCSGAYGATRLVIPAPGTYNADTNPPRIAARNLFDASVGIDNLFHNEKVKTNLKLMAVNITDEAVLYNFLSTFSGTHWVSPRTLQLSLGWAF